MRLSCLTRFNVFSLKKTKEYFLNNDIDDISPESLWAAHKTVVRGKLIQISTKHKREQRAEIDKFEKSFLLLRKLHKRNPSKISLCQLDEARLALNLALTTEAEKNIRKASARFYSQREAPSWRTN